MRVGFLAGGALLFVAGITAIQAAGVEPTSGDMAALTSLLVGGWALLPVGCLLVALGAVTPGGDSL